MTLPPRTSLSPLLFLLVALGLPALAMAQPAPDMAVAKALKKAGLHFELDDDNDFRVLYYLPEDRSQLAIVRSPIESYGKTKVREIWSASFKVVGPMDGGLAIDLLQRNRNHKLGAFQLHETPDGFVVLFVAQVSAKLKPKALNEAIQMVVSSADSLEQELTGEDIY